MNIMLGVGDRADARDRPAAVRRRARRGRADAVPRGVDRPEPARAAPSASRSASASRAAVSRLMQWSAMVTPSAVAMSFGVAAAIGVFFGFYPARKGRAAESDRCAAATVEAGLQTRLGAGDTEMSRIDGPQLPFQMPRLTRRRGRLAGGRFEGSPMDRVRKTVMTAGLARRAAPVAPWRSSPRVDRAWRGRRSGRADRGSRRARVRGGRCRGPKLDPSDAQKLQVRDIMQRRSREQPATTMEGDSGGGDAGRSALGDHQAVPV